MDGGPPLAVLSNLAERTSLSLHGTGLNIAGRDPIQSSYLQRLLNLKNHCQTEVISDHLCFTSSGGQQSYDLLPPIRTIKELERISRRIDEIQNFLQCPLILENVSSYVASNDDIMSEGEFLNGLAAQTGCQILLDINNVFVSAHNHRFDPREEIERFPSHAIAHYHIAGHDQGSCFYVDTHQQLIADQVLELLTFTLETHGPRMLIFERDDSYSIDLMADELSRLEKVYQNFFREQNHAILGPEIHCLSTR